jgi:hypothetical protein
MISLDGTETPGNIPTWSFKKKISLRPDHKPQKSPSNVSFQLNMLSTKNLYNSDQRERDSSADVTTS